MTTYNDYPYSERGGWVMPSGGLMEPSDVAILGVPTDAASTGASGQRSAPLAIRSLEAFESLWDYHVEDGIKRLKVVDAGDVATDYSNFETTTYEIVERAARIREHTGTLVALGGDHSITPHVLAGLGGVELLVHLDAHSDTWLLEDPSWVPHHGAWVPYVIQHETVRKVHQYGLRALGPDNPEDASFGGKLEQYPWHGPYRAIERMKEVIHADGIQRVYLSVDLDVVDPAYAPGVAYPEPGGWTSRELFEVITSLCATGKIVGLDIVECIPALDVRDMTVRLAHRCVLAALRGVAKAKQAGRI